MRNLVSVSLITLSLVVAEAEAGSHGQVEPNDQILSLITEWLGGSYNNSAQVAADVANSVSEEKRSQPIHQIIAPVDLEGFEGLTYFQQTSTDGTVDSVAGVGIFHVLVDDETSQVVLRLRLFKERGEYINAHLDESKLRDVTMDDLYWNDGCEFYLSVTEDAAAIHGVMKDDNCYPVVRSTGKKIKHTDEVYIRPNALWNNGKFYDLDGNFLFGNVTDDYQKQVRLGD